MAADPQPGFHIFLSYRREGTSAHAGRLHDFLVNGVDDQPGFADEQIFMDIDTIMPGDDFRAALADAVATCDVLLAVIGRNWTTVADADGERRLENPADYVRLEIEAALEREIPVVPVLVDDAPMPKRSELPDSMADLTYRNAVELTDKRWRYDVGQLLFSLRRREQGKSISAHVAQATSDASPTTDQTLETGTPPTLEHKEPVSAKAKPRVQLESIGLSPDGTLLVLEGPLRDNQRVAIRVVDVENGARLLDLEAPGSIVWSFDFTPDCRLLAAAIADTKSGTARVWDVRSGRAVFVGKHEHVVQPVALSPDGRLLAAAETRGWRGAAAKIWSVASGEIVLELTPRSRVHDLAFSPNGHLLAAGAWKQKAWLWEVESGEEVLELDHGRGQDLVALLAFSPDGRLVATRTHPTSVVRIWEVESGKELFARRTLHARPTYIPGGAFSPDGALLAIGEEDDVGTAAVRAWSVDTGMELAFIKHPYSVSSVAFAPHGDLLTACGDLDDDHPEIEVRAWDINTGAQLRILRLRGSALESGTITT